MLKLFSVTSATGARQFAWILLVAVGLLSTVVLTRQPGTATRVTREDAYRANNLGVARLEQFDYAAAAQEFRRALEIAPDLAIARVNLAIAQYYAGDLTQAVREAEAVRKQDSGLLQADYIIGLVARAENRNEDAIAAFERVRRADTNDVGCAINLGQLYLQVQRFSEAVEVFRQATRLEPYQATAAYGLATALLRSGSREEGSDAMSRFQKLRDSGYATTFSQNYLEQGHYAAAIASTGAEPELVDKAVPEVRFSNVTDSALPVGATLSPALALFDVDADGDLDLALGTREGVALLRNDRGRFAPAAGASALARAGQPTGIVAGDCNNDERPDLLLLLRDSVLLFAQQPDRSYQDVTTASRLPKFPVRTAAWADADHDGDLDIVAPPFLMRNNGNGTFADISAAAGLGSITSSVAVAPADYDNRRDIDFLVLRETGRPVLLQNMRDGSFRDAAEASALTNESAWTGIASGDVNKDGFVDFFLSRAHDPGLFVISANGGRFTLSDAPQATLDALAAQFLDYDNDGLLDLFVLTGGNAPTMLRNVGNAWLDVTAGAFERPAAVGGMTDAIGHIAAGDLDGDGDTDVVTTLGTNVRVWRNEGGNRHPSLKVQLSARVSNRSGFGSKVEMRAGSLSQQIETVSATPSPAPADVAFGLGNRRGADVVRVLWPAGILQAEVAPEGKLLSGDVPVRELDRKPSSCPYLYTWNGSRFEFVTDFLGGGEMGYWVAPGVRNTPDPDEYVRIEGRQLQPRNRRYELRVTNELEEALFLDGAKLIAVDHPAGTEVYPNEGMGEAAKPFELFVTRNATPPLIALDGHGHDVLDRISKMDRTYPDDFALEAVRGYARRHWLTLTLPRRGPDTDLVLLLTGWTDYAFSRDNVAASQQGLTLEPPSLQTKDSLGRWRTVIKDIGVPVGRPQTVPVDLSSLPADTREVRIVATMRIYWDRIAVAAKGGQPPHQRGQPHFSAGGQPHFFAGSNGKSVAVPFGAKSVAVPLLAATLRWRGFSAEVTPDGREPFVYDYSRVTADAPWKLMPGRYTREGNVRELLTGVDDMFVVARTGDEIALSFDAEAVPPPAPGLTRTFLLHADGFSKEMDHHSSSPDTLEPLPFHRMTQYPYSHPERYPDDKAHREYVARYNTRVVPRAVPRIDSLSRPTASHEDHEDTKSTKKSTRRFF